MTDLTERIATFRGKRVDEMTIEEAREAVLFLGQAYDNVLKTRIAERQFERELREIRQRGEDEMERVRNEAKAEERKGILERLLRI